MSREARNHSWSSAPSPAADSFAPLKAKAAPAGRACRMRARSHSEFRHRTLEPLRCSPACGSGDQVEVDFGAVTCLERHHAAAERTAGWRERARPVREGTPQSSGSPFARPDEFGFLRANFVANTARFGRHCARGRPSRQYPSDFGGILFAGFGHQLANEEFLKDVEDGGFANSNGRVFEY